MADILQALTRLHQRIIHFEAENTPHYFSVDENQNITALSTEYITWKSELNQPSERHK